MISPCILFWPSGNIGTFWQITNHSGKSLFVCWSEKLKCMILSVKIILYLKSIDQFFNALRSPKSNRRLETNDIIREKIKWKIWRLKTKFKEEWNMENESSICLSKKYRSHPHPIQPCYSPKFESHKFPKAKMIFLIS